jgi:hypothetical protein
MTTATDSGNPDRTRASFVETDDEDDEVDDDVIDKVYIRPQYEPWQLKNCYEIKNEE